MPFNNYNLSIEVQDFIKKLQKLDLSPIAYKLMYSDESKRLNKVETTQAITHYLMFLVLVYLYPNNQLVPSKEVDRVWHHHILDTAKYAQDTQMLFGRFIHHFPYFGYRSETDRGNQQSAFMQTQMLFQKHFGIETSRLQISQLAADCQPIGNKTDLSRPDAKIELSTMMMVK